MTTRRWGPEFIITAAAGVQDGGCLAALAGGGFVAVWRDAGASPSAIKCQRFDDLGNAVGGAIEIGAAIAGTHSEPSVTGLADGSFMVTWTNPTAGDNHIEGEVYDAAGNFARAQPVVFPQGPDSDSHVAATSEGGSVAVWTDPDGNFDLVNAPNLSSDILIRFFDAAGTGGAIQVVNATDVLPTGDDDDLRPSVAASSHGTIVAWSKVTPGDSGDISFTLFDLAGTRIVTEGDVTTAGGTQSDPVVVWLEGGAFVVVWRDSSGALPGNGDDIRCKLFAANGSPMTETILVNGTLISDQTAPAVSAMRGGGFAIAWTDASTSGGDSDGTAIKLQAFDGSGNRLGGELLVNSTTDGAQREVSMTSLRDGRLAVGWTDAATGNLLGQIVDPRDGVIDGTSGNDVLFGHDALGDMITGLGGADTVEGLAGDDVILGGGGTDDITCGRGNDTASGGSGIDVIRGLSGDDELLGGIDNDTLWGGKGDDILNGEGGNDVLRGGDGADAMNGNIGTDVVSYSDATTGIVVYLDGSAPSEGDAAGDTFQSVENAIGSTDSDTISGTAGVNGLTGLGASDTLDGLGGADRLTGGADGDALTGGLGNDIFVYALSSEGGDYIFDFMAANGDNDKFQFTGSVFGGLAAGGLAAMRFQNDGTSSAANGDIRFIYNENTSELWFDSDGADGAAAVLMATLQDGAVMALNDFIIV